MGRDRISALPDEVIHHIFSFIDMGTVARTTFLAKRWRYLFLQTPILYFNTELWMSYDHSPQTDSKFLSLVDKVVLENDSRNVLIKKFDLVVFMTGNFNGYHVISWLFAALLRNVNHIHLKFPICDPMKFPHQMFTSNSNLEVLEIDCCFFNTDARIQMPNTLCTAPRIKRLHLYEVLFPDGDANGELVLACPLLEDLELDTCDVSNITILTISTPRIVKMGLLDVFTHDDTSCKVKAYTPNLQELNIQAKREYEDRQFIVDYFMEDLSSLAKANIDVDTDQVDDILTKRWSTSLSGILSKVHNLQSLKLLCVSVQILLNISELLQKLPNRFHKLKYVKLDDPCKAPLHILLKIMRGIPRLETLSWWSCPLSKHEPWAEEMSFDCIFHHLKSIKIGSFGGRANDFTFLEFLLKKAPILENVDIIGTCEISDDKDLVKLYNKLQALPRASSTVTIRGIL